MKTTSIPENDPLGLESFELTELAYDIAISLEGAYSRIIFHEEEKSKPDFAKIKEWEARRIFIHAQKQTLDFSDFEAMREFIKVYSQELRDLYSQYEYA